MKTLTTLLTILLFTFVSFGQDKKADKPDFDIIDFNKKFEVAEWLVEYDLVAWKTTDEVMKQDKTELAKLGREWFCFQDKNNVWHAVYGKFTDEKYDLVFHFKIDKDSKIVKTDEKMDAEFLNLHAKALQTANKKMYSTFNDDNVPRFNQYIRQNTDKTFNVWLLPAFQTNGLAVYGGEYIYTLDKTASKITKDESHFQGNFRAFKTGNPREVWIKYNELEKPTLGAIFFVWYYRNYFTKINLETSKSISSVINISNIYTWVHIEKELEPKDKIVKK